MSLLLSYHTNAIASRLDSHLITRSYTLLGSLRFPCLEVESCIIHEALCSQNTKSVPTKEESHISTFPLLSIRNIMPYATHDSEFDPDFIGHGQVNGFDPHFHDADKKYFLNRDIPLTSIFVISCKR